MGKPIITSDRDFARVVCGDAALYVDPCNPAAIADALMTLSQDAAWAERTEAGRRRFRMLMQPWSAIAERFVDALVRAARGESQPPVSGDAWFREAAQCGLVLGERAR
jgi:glycosyltransferase involved in cell wall biosynthesis